MLSLSSLGALFFRGGLVRKVVTGYSGDTFPNFTPNPMVPAGYTSGEVEVEHWSFLAFAQRLEAAARGLAGDRHPLDRRLVDGGQRRRTPRVDTPFGAGRTARTARADVALLHAPVADRAGNVAVAPPLLEGVWGALGGAARRDRHRRARRRRPAAVVAPRAHPGAPGARGVRGADGRASRRAVPPASSRSTATARTTTSGSRPGPRARRDDYDEWIRHWILEPADQGTETPFKLQKRSTFSSACNTNIY